VLLRPTFKVRDLVPPTLLCTVTFPANTGFAWDFIERLYARMANQLAQQGVRTLVAYPAIEDAPRTLAGSAAIPVVLDIRLRTWRERLAMAEFIRRENVLVVYFTDRPLWSPWYPLLRFAGVRKIIVHDHTSGARTVPSGIRRAIKRALVSLPGVAADLVVAVSNYVAERDRAVGLLAPEKIRRIWNGVDPIRARSEEDAQDVRKLLQLSPSTVVIGCACRATPEKGVDVLFNAFDRVARTSPVRPVLVYIGDGPEMDKLSLQRDGLASRDSIHMLGYLPGASDLLRTANVCVVPSVWEDAFPLAVLEMMARGRAVVATRVGGVPEMIEHGVSGLLVAPNDADALASAIETLLAEPLVKDAYGRAARERASFLFTAERQIAEMVDTFRDVFQAEYSVSVSRRSRVSP
jgi:glycosyltransferase involved in cell wall biosynthesis